MINQYQTMSEERRRFDSDEVQTNFWDDLNKLRDEAKNDSCIALVQKMQHLVNHQTNKTSLKLSDVEPKSTILKYYTGCKSFKDFARLVDENRRITIRSSYADTVEISKEKNIYSFTLS